MRQSEQFVAELQITHFVVRAFQKLIPQIELQEEVADENDVIKSINQSVSTEIAKFAVPSAIYCVENLPKTRSGKVMRRLLRKLATGEEDLGDTSTLLDVSVLDHIRNAINNK